MTSNSGFREIRDQRIALHDGRELAARLWLPQSASLTPAPAILEYLPYRQRDGTAWRDESNYPVFAEAGYAGVRVDISGTGESDGDFDDEYSPRELADGVEIIAWIAEQDWCDGNVGMMGISWGGFNSLQIAALQPPALKAVIAIGTTVDRYNDDIHYKNGCLLYSNFWWSAVMLCYASRPPDPAIVGDRWRGLWRERLNSQPLPLETWLAHQHRDDYWRHGSVCEDYEAIKVPSLVISGWADGYVNAPPAAAQYFGGLAKAVNGPWIHKYPHFALPHPRMDFHAEALRWWDRWLRDVENGAESVPAYRAYISEAVRPGDYREQEPGRWVAEPSWPSPSIKNQVWFTSSQGNLTKQPPASASALLRSPLATGIAAGEWFTAKPDSELSADQRIDDVGSLVFDTAPLSEAIEILGRPLAKFELSLDQPLGNLAVRLVDVHPDGVCHRVSWGVINLAHRDGNATPEALTPGERIRVSIQLDECGYRFLSGHQIRLSVSTSYWPMIHPPPTSVTATVYLGAETQLSLPVRPSGDSHEVPTPAADTTPPPFPQHTPAEYQRVVETDRQNRVTRLRVIGDDGEVEIPPHGMRTRHRHEDCWSIADDDPLSARFESVHNSWMSRDGWSTRTICENLLTCDRNNFYVSARVTAYDNGTEFNVRDWKVTIPRNLV